MLSEFDVTDFVAACYFFGGVCDFWVGPGFSDFADGFFESERFVDHILKGN